MKYNKTAKYQGHKYSALHSSYFFYIVFDFETFKSLCRAPFVMQIMVVFDKAQQTG